MMFPLAVETALDPDKVQAGWLAVVFVAGLAIALVFLLRSLNKQLKKVDFPERKNDDSGPAEGEPDQPDDTR